MMIPTVHLNGTGKASLQAELRTAYEALEDALKALRSVTVHGRDYYPQGPEAYSMARAEMDIRIGALGKVQQDVLTMWQALDGAK